MPGSELWRLRRALVARRIAYEESRHGDRTELVLPSARTVLTFDAEGRLVGHEVRG